MAKSRKQAYAAARKTAPSQPMLRPERRESSPLVQSESSLQNADSLPTTRYVDDPDLRSRLSQYRCILGAIHRLYHIDSENGNRRILGRADFLLCRAYNEIWALTTPMEERVAQLESAVRQTGRKSKWVRRELEREAREWKGWRDKDEGDEDAGAERVETESESRDTLEQGLLGTASAMAKRRRVQFDDNDEMPQNATIASLPRKAATKTQKKKANPTPNAREPPQKKRKRDLLKELEIVGTSRLGNLEARDGDGLSPTQYQDSKGRWFSVPVGGGRPDWAVAERRQPRGRDVL